MLAGQINFQVIAWRVAAVEAGEWQPAAFPQQQCAALFGQCECLGGIRHDSQAGQIPRK